MSFLQYILILLIVILLNEKYICITTIESTTFQSIADKIAAQIRKIENDLKIEEEQLKTDREKFEKEQQITKIFENTEIIRVNVGGEIMITTCETFTRISNSILSMMFSNQWKEKLSTDQNGNIFLDFNPILFRHLLDQLQLFHTNNLNDISPPSDSSLVIPFKKMIQKLSLNHSVLLTKNILTFNVGGQMITNHHRTFNRIFDTIVSLSNITQFNNINDAFLDYHPKLFQQLVNHLRIYSSNDQSDLDTSSYRKNISSQTILNGSRIFRQFISSSSSSRIKTNTKWKEYGITIAGGNGQGNELNQLSNPQGIYVDDNDQCIYIADTGNHRIVKWKYNAKIGEVVAGGNGQGNRMNQLYTPTDMVVDKINDSLIICDANNRRMVQWSRRNGTNGETIISDIDCSRLATDNNGDVYISNYRQDEVRRWKKGERIGTIVAGGNGKGDNLSQLSNPMYIFVDRDYSIYVSDRMNNRVMKWMKDAKEGILVAGGNGQGSSMKQLAHPQGVTVDRLDRVYVADNYNDRIIRWSKGFEEGTIIVGGNGGGAQANQFNYLGGLSFDQQGNLYVADYFNHRVQKFEIDLN